jgi:hypothetical protein
MLKLTGNRQRMCDGASRRSFLQVGGLAMGGLSLPQIMQAQAAAGETSQHKAVIMVFLAGGPPHQDMLDLKPEAPSEVRGEFDPISTNVPGIQISELMPRVASMMDRLPSFDRWSEPKADTTRLNVAPGTTFEVTNLKEAGQRWARHCRV